MDLNLKDSKYVLDMTLMELPVRNEHNITGYFVRKDMRIVTMVFLLDEFFIFMEEQKQMRVCCLHE